MWPDSCMCWSSKSKLVSVVLPLYYKAVLLHCRGLKNSAKVPASFAAINQMLSVRVCW